MQRKKCGESGEVARRRAVHGFLAIPAWFWKTNPRRYCTLVGRMGLWILYNRYNSSVLRNGIDALFPLRMKVSLSWVEGTTVQ